MSDKMTMTIANSFDPDAGLYQNIVVGLVVKDGELYDQYPSATHDSYLVAIKEGAKVLGVQSTLYGVYNGTTGHIHQIPDEQYQGMMKL